MPHQDLTRSFFFKHINPSLQYRIFKWYETGPLGVGKPGVPFVDMTHWINTEGDQAIEVWQEIEKNIHFLQRTNQPFTGAYVPEDINNQKFLNYYVWKAEEFIPPDKLAEFNTVGDVTNWICDQGLVPKSWQNMYYIMNTRAWSQNGTSRAHKTGMVFTGVQSDGVWGAEFPLFKKWIDSWGIFQKVSRIVLFQNVPGNPIMIHRDAKFFPHKMHMVSLQFKPGRKGFVYNELTKEKIYYNVPAYTFNTCDNHGVDTDDTDAFTVRIDGEFVPEVCTKLGLEDGYIWNSGYPSIKQLMKIKIFEPNERP